MNTDEKDPITHAIMGAAFEVANMLGHGFLEAVYQKALLRELELRGLKAEREVPFRIGYKGAELGTYVADLVVEGRVIVELKAIESLSKQHIGQCMNYLRASGLRTALLLNFGRAQLEYKRVSM